MMRESQETARQLRMQAVEQAAEWLVRLQNDELSYPQIEEWHRWMEASVDNAQAFDDVSLTWQAAAGLPAMPAVAPVATTTTTATATVTTLPVSGIPTLATAEIAPPAAATSNSSRRRRALRRWAAAAVIAAVAFSSALLLNQPWNGSRDEIRTYASGRGEIRQIVLEDASRVQLGPDSQLRVQMSSRRRQLELTAGQAYFEVYKDPSRPFEVRARGVMAQALGTRFSVDYEPGQVTVSEGRVQVNDLSPDGAASLAGATSVQLVAGQQTRLDPGYGLRRPEQANVEDALAWKDGVVVYDREPLGNVIAELNRYSRTPVTLVDATLARQLVTGRWQTADVDAWLNGIAEAFSLQIQHRQGRIVLSAKQDAATP